MPASAKTSANLSRYISFTAENPWAITTPGTVPSLSGRYSHPRSVVPSALNSTSVRFIHDLPACAVSPSGP